MQITNNLSAISYSLQGINQAQKMLNSSAQNIATGSGELEKEMSNQIIAENSQAANIKTAQTQDEMLAELMHIVK